MTTDRPAPGERGMTLVEMMVALVVFGIVAGGALSFFLAQSRAFRKGTERLDVVQNLRFAAGLLEQDLRTMGANVPPGQPYLVYAGPAAVAISADYATNAPADPFAVYYDPDLPAGAVTTILPAQRIAIPTGAFQYPDRTYRSTAGTNSPAELIVFYFTPDSLTSRADDYLLLRQVNALAPEVVARHLLATPGLPFFQYYRVFGSPLAIQQVPDGQLPWAHAAEEHLGAADTMPLSAIDAIRGVRFNFTATNGLTGAAERQRAISRLVRLPNAAFTPNRRTCGDEPLNGTGFAVGNAAGVNGEPLVRLVWNRSIDEGGGESDVVGYTVWRRLASEPDWGDPWLSFPAGFPAYTYDDLVVTPGETYYYAMAAQDCTPSLSALAIAGPVTIP